MPMLKGRVSFPVICCLLASLFMASGCGGSSSELQVAGKLTHNGQPLQISEDGAVIMVFCELQDGRLGERSYPASVNSTGDYNALLLPGEYRVAVQLMDPYATQTDKFRGAFDQMKSSVTVEITESKKDLDIDLKK